MEDSNQPEHNHELPINKINKEPIEIKDVNNNITQDSINKGNKEITVDKKSEENKNVDLNVKPNVEIDKTKDIFKKDNDATIKDNKIEDSKLSNAENNFDKSNKIVDKANSEITKNKNSENSKKIDLTAKSDLEIDKTKNNSKQISTTIPVKAKKPVKEPPIEKKPFLEFINDYLIPEIKNEFKLKGKEITKINLQKTHRPIAEDICWVIYCEINDTCNFWLSFEKDDITSLKSFSLCKNYEKPSIIESFLIDEKKITLKLIISRILQRLNGQKLIGAN